MVRAVSSKRLLEARWNVRVALGQERVPDHVGKWAQWESRLGVGVHRKVLRESGARWDCVSRWSLLGWSG